jgi:carotenoid 1,2-hydratase
MNVALYSPRASAWAFAESAIPDAGRAEDRVSIAGSTMEWRDDRLVATINERTIPMRLPLRGTVIVHPLVPTNLELTIDGDGLHRWWPAAPLARIEVDLPVPGLRFAGHGYYDANAGSVPLDRTFEAWNWSRATNQNFSFLTYDIACATGAERSIAFKLSKNGEVTWRTPSPSMALPRTAWGIDRRIRADPGDRPRIIRSLEDGPFYGRALVEASLEGEKVIAMHEVLAAHRLRRRWVHFLTRFRMRSAS